MRVTAHRPATWFLLEQSGRYLLLARVTRSAADYEILIELTPQETREYRAIGELYLDYLAARVQSFSEEYAGRDLGRQMGKEVTRAIEEWRAADP